MKRTIKQIAPWLAAAAMGGALFLAPVASAVGSNTGPDHSNLTGPDGGASPLVPYGTTSNSNLPFNDGGSGDNFSPAGAV